MLIQLKDFQSYIWLTNDLINRHVNVELYFLIVSRYKKMINEIVYKEGHQSLRRP